MQEKFNKNNNLWVLLIVFLLIIIGFGVWFWQETKIKSMQRTIETLKIEKNNFYSNDIEKKDDHKANSSEANSTKEIIEATNTFCEDKKLICPNIQLIEKDDKYAITDGGKRIKYFLVLKDNKWQVILGTEEDNICETGTDSPDLFGYCESKK